MSKDLLREAGHSPPIGKSIITALECSQLRRLYAELPNAAAAARQILKFPGAVRGSELQRFREANAKLLEIIDSIKGLVG